MAIFSLFPTFIFIALTYPQTYLLFRTLPIAAEKQIGNNDQELNGWLALKTQSLFWLSKECFFGGKRLCTLKSLLAGLGGHVGCRESNRGLSCVGHMQGKRSTTVVLMLKPQRMQFEQKTRWNLLASAGIWIKSLISLSNKRVQVCK